MTDHTELKRLAEAIESCTSIPENDEAAWMRRTTGKAVVELIDEVDELKAENKRLRRAEKNDAIAYKAVIERQEELRAENQALVVEKEKAFADGRLRGLDEAQNLCYQMALREYRPEGSRYTLFTPKKERMLGDVLVQACNAIADLPDGPYERQRIKREQKAAMSKEPSNG